ncbi:MAG: type II toxin-antitoxin system HicB family antitoxin [Methanophagales archaeon]|nr:type II toxin-antitoxin system HicB family antitoxin [Methanophagales archaeon]
MKKLIATVEIWKEGGMFTAYCPELDVASCGHTSEEAKKNLREVIEIQLEETAKLGTLNDFFFRTSFISLISRFFLSLICLKSSA